MMRAVWMGVGVVGLIMGMMMLVVFSERLLGLGVMLVGLLVLIW